MHYRRFIFHKTFPRINYSLPFEVKLQPQQRSMNWSRPVRKRAVVIEAF
jgi:hypothetical protein